MTNLVEKTDSKTRVISPYYSKAPLSGQDWLGQCCGARVLNNVTSKTKFTGIRTGIKVFVGKHHGEYDSGKSYLSHVETSAGPLTVVIKYD